MPVPYCSLLRDHARDLLPVSAQYRRGAFSEVEFEEPKVSNRLRCDSGLSDVGQGIKGTEGKGSASVCYNEHAIGVREGVYEPSSYLRLCTLGLSIV